MYNYLSYFWKTQSSLWWEDVHQLERTNSSANEKHSVNKCGQGYKGHSMKRKKIKKLHIGQSGTNGGSIEKVAFAYVDVPWRAGADEKLRF